MNGYGNVLAVAECNDQIAFLVRNCILDHCVGAFGSLDLLAVCVQKNLPVYGPIAFSIDTQYWSGILAGYGTGISSLVCKVAGAAVFRDGPPVYALVVLAYAQNGGVEHL